MSFRRANKSHKVRMRPSHQRLFSLIILNYQVPNVKLRPAQPSKRSKRNSNNSPSLLERTRTEDSGFDSDQDTSFTDHVPRPFKGVVLCATGLNDKVRSLSHLHPLANAGMLTWSSPCGVVGQIFVLLQLMSSCFIKHEREC